MEDRGLCCGVACVLESGVGGGTKLAETDGAVDGDGVAVGR